MEFWGVEVKPGESLKVKPQLYKMIHISQASLGELKNAKGNVNVPLRLKIDGKSFVMGFLSTEDRPQMMVDLVFGKEFELSHDWKNGSNFTEDENSDDEDIPTDEDVELPNGIPVKGERQINGGGNSDSDESEDGEDDDAADDSSDFSASDDEPLPKDIAQETSSSDDEPEPPKQNQLNKKRVEPVTKKPKLSAPPQKAGFLCQSFLHQGLLSYFTQMALGDPINWIVDMLGNED
ncbi:hypothetical protein LIER_27396 [Lithospermum erythrorhizon]|uniref:Nucleoplasmin-like domain-containing protein n=1 Tax=Lithospermum erythrorhizon TaxID=34254 RepID=A0AAV3RBX4_LITER